MQLKTKSILFYLLIFMACLVVWIYIITTKIIAIPNHMTRDSVNAMDAMNQPLVQSVMQVGWQSIQSSDSTWKIQYINYINGVKASRENVYITEPKYTSRQKPSYFNDPPNSLWQFTTYMSAGELARRYHAKYIIDLGCGSGSKLAAFQKEFHLIGIDYKENLKRTQKAYPFIDVVDVDLDQGPSCQLRISPDILSQAVVVSADVIEHLVDPFNCYMKVLQVSQK